MTISRQSRYKRDMTFDIKPGDIVRYETFDGTTRIGVVINRLEIVPGKMGFDLALDECAGVTVWGYDSQITEHHPR